MKKRYGTIVLAVMLAANMTMAAFAAPEEPSNVAVLEEETVCVTGSEEDLNSVAADEAAFASSYASSDKKAVAGYWHFSDGVLSYTSSSAGSVGFDSVKADDVKKVIIASGPTSNEDYKCREFANLEEVVFEAPLSNRDMCVISKSMFESCPKLKKVTVGKGRAGSGFEFDARAFYNCPLLTEVSLGTGIWQMGRNTFGDCVGLKSFKFSDDCHDIRGDTFWGCTNLTNISIASTNKFIKVDHNAAYEYFDPYVRADWGGVTRPGAYITPCLIFVPEGVVKQNGGKYTVTKGIKDIQFWTFMGDKSLTDVTLASTVESIQLEAFLHCENLKSVTLPKSLKRVGQNVFSLEEPGKKGAYQTDNVNPNLKDIYYQGTEEEWKQIEFAIYTLDEGHINRMTIEGRDKNGKVMSSYQKEYLYNNLERAGIPADVTIHFNSELKDTDYVLGKSTDSKETKTDEIYQESEYGASDDTCTLEKSGKVWELKSVSANGVDKVTLAKGNKVKLPNFSAIVTPDSQKSVVVSKKGVLSAKKDTAGSPVSVTYTTTDGKTVTLNVCVITPAFSSESVSADAVISVKKLTVTASLAKGQSVDRVLVIPENYSIKMNKVSNKSGADCTLKKEADGKIHLRAQFTKKGKINIPVYVNGKAFKVKVVMKN